MGEEEDDGRQEGGKGEVAKVVDVMNELLLNWICWIVFVLVVVGYDSGMRDIDIVV